MALVNDHLGFLYPPVVLVDARFCMTSEVHLRFRSSSNDDMQVTEAYSDVPFFVCSSLRQTKMLYDNVGHLVWIFKHNVMPFSTKCHVLSPNGAKLYTIREKRRWFDWWQQGTKLTVCIPQGVICLKASATNGIAVITLKGADGLVRVVGRVSLSDKYVLECCPGIDVSVLVSLVIALEIV